MSPALLLVAFCAVVGVLRAPAASETSVEALLGEAGGAGARVDALVALGPPGVEPLLRCLERDAGVHAVVVAAALERIAVVSPPAPGVLSEWAADLRRPLSVRRVAVRVLGLWNDSDAVPVLAGLLDDAAVRLDAIAALGMLGDEKAVSALAGEASAGCGDAFRALIAMLCDDEVVAATSVLQALTGLEPDAAPGLRRLALVAMAARGGLACRDNLLAALGADDEGVRQAALRGCLRLAGVLAAGGEGAAARELLRDAIGRAHVYHHARALADAAEGLGEPPLSLAAWFPLEVAIGESEADAAVLDYGWSRPFRDEHGPYRWACAYAATLRIPVRPVTSVTAELWLTAPAGAVHDISLRWHGTQPPAITVEGGAGRFLLSLRADEVGAAAETLLTLRHRQLDSIDDQRPGNEPFHRGVQLRKVRVIWGVDEGE